MSFHFRGISFTFSDFMLHIKTHNLMFFQEADKHAKELIEDEEKRKDKTERNKRKKLVSVCKLILI